MKKLALICLAVFAFGDIARSQSRFSPAVIQKVKAITPLADSVRNMAEKLVKSGFNAGSGYGEVWVRDFNTFMAVACHVDDKAEIKNHLLTFFKFQQSDGGILDGYVPVDKSARVNYNYYYAASAPGYAGHKNTVETDQENSLIQAIAKYIRTTGDESILTDTVFAVTIQKHLEQAMFFLLDKRFDKTHGLIWGATTVDWGDVQPEQSWGVVLDENTHKTIDIYDNAMFVIAINDYLSIAHITNTERNFWANTRNNLKANIRKYLWDDVHQKFRPHIYLNGSPFPASFDEDAIYYHGGTAVAIEADLLTHDEVRTAYKKMQEDVKAANASTIGLTIYPVYPAGFFKNKSMGPYSYQNGGDWGWFGGRMVTQLIRYNLLDEACDALKPMLDRVIKNKGFYEWYTPDNKPKGSAGFRGEAGVLWAAVTALNAKVGK